MDKGISLGRILREAREQRGITLERLYEATKIRPDLLEALEEEEYHKLPSRTYILGFIRSYARYVGLDPEPLCQILPEEEEVSAPFRPPPPRPKTPGHGGITIISAAVLAIASLLGLYLQSRGLMSIGAGAPAATRASASSPIATSSGPSSAEKVPTSAPTQTKPVISSTAVVQAQIPVVTGMPLEQAIKTLRSAGFWVSYKEAPAANSSAGTVVKQQPDSGSLVPRGSRVELMVSTGEGG